MGHLRDQMQSDLKLRNRSDGTIYKYLGACFQLAKYHRIAPEVMEQRHLRTFFNHLIDEKKLSPGTLRVYIAAVKFLFMVTLSRPEFVSWLAFPRMPKKLPDILTPDEVLSLIGAADSQRTRCWLLAGYGAGLRISDVCCLRPEHILSKESIIHVHNGKGAKDRLVPLSPVLLEALRCYWVEAHPKGGWLFPGAIPGQPVSTTTVQTHFQKARVAARLKEGITFHSLRRSFATHQLEANVDMATIQATLGHESIGTSMRYIRLQRAHIVAAGSPLDRLPLTSRA